MKILVKGYFSLKKAMQDKSVVELEKEAASIRDITAVQNKSEFRTEPLSFQ
jgi:hypothetical protein